MWPCSIFVRKRYICTTCETIGMAPVSRLPIPVTINHRVEIVRGSRQREEGGREGKVGRPPFADIYGLQKPLSVVVRIGAG